MLKQAEDAEDSKLLPWDYEAQGAASRLSFLETMARLLQSGFAFNDAELRGLISLCWNNLPKLAESSFPPQSGTDSVWDLSSKILCCLLPFQQALNLGRCYSIPEKTQIDPANCLMELTLADDWLVQLKQFLPSEQHEELDRHLNDSYALKGELQQLLKILYARLSGQLDHELRPLSMSEKAALCAKLAEGIDECTPGYHARIQYLVNFLAMPRTLDEYLFRIRMNEMDAVIREISQITEEDRIEGYDEGYEVHKHNSLFAAAHSTFGVVAPNPSDPYEYPVTHAQQAYIKNQFKWRYNANTLLPNLLACIRVSLENLGYRGKLDLAAEPSGYSYTEYTGFIEHLTHLLGIQGDFAELLKSMMLQQGASVEPTDADEIKPFVDINWKFLEKKLREKLFIDGYFEKPVHQEAVVEFMAIRLRDLIRNGKVEELKAQLIRSVQWPRDLLEEVFKWRGRSGCNILMLAAHHNTASVELLIKAIKTLDEPSQQAIFEQANKEGRKILERATYLQKDAVACFIHHLSDEQLLGMLPDNIEPLKKVVAQLKKTSLDPEQKIQIARLILKRYIDFQPETSQHRHSPRFLCTPPVPPQPALTPSQLLDAFTPAHFHGQQGFVKEIGELAFGPALLWLAGEDLPQEETFRLCA